MQIHGSTTLGNTLLASGLVDTVLLAVAPTVVGAGRRLLSQPGAAAGLDLVDHEVTGTGLLLLEYQVTGEAPTGEYDGVTALS